VRRLLSFVKKELLVAIKDPKTRMLLIGPPLLQLLIFSFAATLELKNATVAIYDEDRRSGSTALINRLRGSNRVFKNLIFVNSPEEGEKLVEKGKGLIFIYIPSDTTEKLERGESVEIGVFTDGRRANASQLAVGYLLRIYRNFGVGERDPPNEDLLVSRNWFNPNLKSTWSTVPGLVALLVNLIVLLTTSLSIARERELGTFEQLLVSPLTKFELLVGKIVPALILGVGEGLIMGLLAKLLFKLPVSPTDFLLLVPIFVLFVLAVSGIGLFISSLSKTQQQAFTGAFTYQVPAVLLSGFATPVGNISPFIRWMAYINPLQYGVKATRAVFLESPTLSQLFAMVMPLLPIALITLSTAALLFRRSDS
jgi:ABC-2 type transport system permease protein